MSNAEDDLILDENGFLADASSWNHQIARQLAALEGIELQEGHWDILELVRQFHEQYAMSPVNRALVKWIREHRGEGIGNSVYLMQLFPGSPARLASRIAGLPKPHNCL